MIIAIRNERRKCQGTFHRCRSTSVRRGISLVEVVVSSLLVGLVLVTSMRATTMVHSSTVAADDTMVLSVAAESILEELRGLAYAEPLGSSAIGIDDNEIQSDRATWDDVDDAAGYRAIGFVQRDGKAVVGGESWKCRIQCQWVDPTTLAVCEEDRGLKKVKIQMTASNAQLAEVFGYFSSGIDTSGNWLAGIQIQADLSSGSPIQFLAVPRNRIVIE